MTEQQLEPKAVRKRHWNVTVDGEDYRAEVGMDPEKARRASAAWGAIAELLEREKAEGAPTPEQELEDLNELVAVYLDNPLSGNVVAQLAEVYHWMAYLPADDLMTCTRELAAVARTAILEGKPHLAAQDLRAWRATAESHRDGLGVGYDEKAVGEALDEMHRQQDN